MYHEYAIIVELDSAAVFDLSGLCRVTANEQRISQVHLKNKIRHALCSQFPGATVFIQLFSNTTRFVALDGYNCADVVLSPWVEDIVKRVREASAWVGLDAVSPIGP